MKSYQSGVCLFLFLFLGLWFTVSAGAEDLDRSFGDQGQVATSVGHVGDQAHAVVVQPDGKIVVGGSSSNSADLDFAVIRYNPDGILDSSFNSDGMVTTAVGRGDDEISALAVQDDGRILAAGYSVNGTARDFALVRYNVDGSLDADFGREGMVVTPVGNGDDEITSMAVDRQGRIVVAGYTTGTLGRAVAVGRYLADGSPDVSFGDQGITLTGIGKDALARSMVLDPKGRIIVAGSYTDDSGQPGVVLLRYLSSGVLDTTFGTDGVAVSADERPGEGFGVRLQDDGAILVAGSVGDKGSRDTALFRFTADGRPDLSFAENGVLVSSVSPGDDMALAVAVQNDTISVSGFSTTTDGKRDFLFMTYGNGVSGSTDGTASATDPDPAADYGVVIGELRVEDSAAGYQAEMTSGTRSPDQGIVTTTSFGSADDVGDALALQPDGKAVVAGFAGDGGATSFAVARYTAVNAANINSPGFTATWIVTKGVNNVTRTGAITGGTIEADSGVTITQRGVVFSIAPDPVLKSGNTGGGGDAQAPVISNTTPADFATGATVTLSVDTDENATCKYSTTAGTVYDSMSSTFETTGTTQHEQNLDVLSDGTHTYWIRCQDAAGHANTSDFEVSFTVGAGTTAFSGNLGGLFAATAHAADTSTTTATTATSQQGFSSTADNFVDEGSTNDGSGPGSFSSIIKNLKPGTSYFVRAYAQTSDGRVYYGNQNIFRTADACFIATAAYGTIINPYVRLLRDFRDRYLLTNHAGRAFVRLYYHYSPPVADYIASRSILRLIVRILLLPLIGMSWLALNFDFSGLLLLTALGVMPCLLLRRAWSRHKSC
ncbi:hypothetical protein MNBD_DELTA04-1423 [hydrothermal vent metagenome]|uniref:Fibronectin type-III domain-containing protein n=1 Tax=hydrothermal vent metagenome TaxID=652676 RepID=A0A3B0V6Y5_9ZZZZ